MYRNEEGWMEEYRKKDAFWLHNGNPKFPHAILTSGKHSNGFFNSRLVIPDEVLMRDAVSDLLEKFVKCDGNIEQVGGVVGPQTGATKLAEYMSDQISAYTRAECFWASPSKNGEGVKKSMVFNDEELDLLTCESVLLNEDVLSTGQSIDLTVDAIVNAGGIVLPYVLVLVNRSGLKEINGRRIISLIDREMPMWEPDDYCPLCKVGSEAIRAKDNWNLLTAPY